MTLCGIYNNIVNSINKFLYSTQDDNKPTEDNEQNNGKGEKEDTENVENLGVAENIEPEDDESLTQSEISKTELSETERIKNTYLFGAPVVRNSLVRIWDKRSYFKCSYCIS